MENDEIINPKPENKSCRHTPCMGTLVAINIILLAGLIGIYVCHFAGIGGVKSKKNPDATPVMVPKDGALKVAYINSDSILAKYQYALDLEKGLRDFQQAKENEYKNKMTTFQNDYQNYLKTGADLTLSQQKAKEEELKQRAEKLSTLEQELALQMEERRFNDNKKLLDAIYAFVREYNEQNQQFDIILRKTYTDPPTLYMNPAMDITDEIIKGLNEEYASLKEK